MRQFSQSVAAFLQSEEGPTSVEYALMLALIMVACMNIASTFGRSVSGTFSKVNNAMS